MVDTSAKQAAKALHKKVSANEISGRSLRSAIPETGKGAPNE